jgi:hypothetical protein
VTCSSTDPLGTVGPADAMRDPGEQDGPQHDHTAQRPRTTPVAIERLLICVSALLVATFAAAWSEDSHVGVVGRTSCQLMAWPGADSLLSHVAGGVTAGRTSSHLLGTESVCPLDRILVHRHPKQVEAGHSDKAVRQLGEDVGRPPRQTLGRSSAPYWTSILDHYCASVRVSSLVLRTATAESAEPGPSFLI